MAPSRKLTLLVPGLCVLALISCSTTSPTPATRATPAILKPPDRGQLPCPEGIHQRVPYRNGTICVTYAYVALLDCLKQKQLPEAAEKLTREVAREFNKGPKCEEALAECVAVRRIDEKDYDEDRDAQECFQRYHYSNPYMLDIFKECNGPGHPGGPNLL